MDTQNKERYFGEIIKLEDGRFKLRWFKKLVGKHLIESDRTWKRVNSRNLARKLKQGKLVTR